MGKNGANPYWLTMVLYHIYIFFNICIILTYITYIDITSLCTACPKHDHTHTLGYTLTLVSYSNITVHLSPYILEGLEV